MRLRRQRRVVPLSNYPVGSFIRTEKGTFYVLSPTDRYRFISQSVLDSWSPARIIEASEADPAVSKLKVVAKMKFRDGSLLYHHATGSMYLVSSHKLKRIINPLILDAMALRPYDAVWISDEELNLHQIGEPLSG